MISVDVDLFSGCDCFWWIFPVEVAVSGGCFQWMWLALVHVALSRGFLVLLSLPEDEGAAFPPWKAAAGVVPVEIFGLFVLPMGLTPPLAAMEGLGIPGNGLKTPATEVIL